MQKKQDTDIFSFGTIELDLNLIDLIKEMEKKYPKMTSEFKNLLLEQYITFIKKQHDYGPSNIAMNTLLETKDDLLISLAGLVTRMNDKMSRLINLILKSKKELENESIEDSFKDISVYGIISRIVINGKWGK